MTIDIKHKDTWSSENYGLPSAIYYYFLNENLYGWNKEESHAILGNCPGIQSIQYTPFISPDDVSLYGVGYDVDRFGKIEDLRPSLTFTPIVYRITSLNKNIKTLGKIQLYDEVTRNPGGVRAWYNESKLYGYPYMFGMLSDDINPPLEIKYHLCDEVSHESNEIEIKVRSTLSDRCSYGLFVEGYKGDENGVMESVVSSDAHELPCSSSAYSQWYASSRNQYSHDLQIQSRQIFHNKKYGMYDNFSNTVQGINLRNPIASVGSVIDGVVGHQQIKNQYSIDKSNLVGGALSQKKDLSSTPSTMLSMGSNIYFGLDRSQFKVKFYRYQAHENDLKRIGDYFALYGYKQNKILKVHDFLRTRYYYNYIKTLSLNVKGEGVPKHHIEQIKDIFNNGVTIWHVENENVSVGDYSKDNYEFRG